MRREAWEETVDVISIAEQRAQLHVYDWVKQAPIKRFTTGMWNV